MGTWTSLSVFGVCKINGVEGSGSLRLNEYISELENSDL